MSLKKALISGVNGQDGSYLAEFLLRKGYDVHGIFRRSSAFNTRRIDHLFSNLNFHTYYGDVIDSSNINRLMQKVEPDEIYNLAAQSHVAVSFEVPEYTAEASGIGAVRFLDGIRDLGLGARYYQASTSELFGGYPETVPQNELTPLRPRSPYAAAKLYAYWVTVNYREAYKLHASNGILFNHESPRRGETFVTKKITMAVADIVKGRRESIALGNLDAKRDWGYAKDYVESMWLIMQQKMPDDYVVATGVAHSVREFVEEAFKVADITISWDGHGVEERGIDAKTGKTRVVIDPRYFRPTEVDYLLGDATKARNVLGWKPHMSFKQLVRTMVEYDLAHDDYDGAAG
jgi:GDPmannose 4,6-dehydratase